MKTTTTGILASVGGVGISLAGVNQVLTCISLCVGIAVGLASLVKIVRKKTNHKNHHE